MKNTVRTNVKKTGCNSVIRFREMDLIVSAVYYSIAYSSVNCVMHLRVSIAEANMLRHFNRYADIACILGNFKTVRYTEFLPV